MLHSIEIHKYYGHMLFQCIQSYTMMKLKASINWEREKQMKWSGGLRSKEIEKSAARTMNICIIRSVCTLLNFKQELLLLAWLIWRFSTNFLILLLQCYAEIINWVKIMYVCELPSTESYPQIFICLCSHCYYINNAYDISWMK